MTSAIDVQKVLSRRKFELLPSKPGATTKTAVKWVSLRDFDSFVAGYLRTVGTAALTSLTIQAADDNSGTNAVDIKVKDVTANPDAVDDYVFVEVSAAEVEGIAPGKEYVALVVEESNAANEAVALYDLDRAHFPQADLTADYIQ